MSEFKYMKRESNGQVDWVAKVPNDTAYKDNCVTEITESEYLFLIQQNDDDMGSPLVD